MSNTQCPICNSQSISKALWNNRINKCDCCGLFFNQIENSFDYENKTRFVSNDGLMALYEKYAKRDFDLIKSEFIGVKTILEIGSGYGLLSVNIKKYYPDIKYFHYEKNLSLRQIYEQRGDFVLEELDKSLCPDLIIMAHCLEHIEDAPFFIKRLLSMYKSADIILFQTNPIGFIPKFLPWLWYGWSLNQHYYHFTVSSLVELMKLNNRSMKSLKYYKLHQEVSLSMKGVIKMFLWFINRFIKNEKMDAYVARFTKHSQS